MRAIWLLAALAMGCNKYKQDDFLVDHPVAICTLYDQCAVIDTFEEFQTYDDCVTSLSSAGSGCDGYDRDAAWSCVDGVNQMDCTALDEEAWPSACDNICSG